MEKCLLSLGVVMDEIDDDPRKALPVARELGLESVELGKVLGKSVADLTAAEVESVRGLLRQYGIRVSMVSTGFLKACRVDLVPDGDFSASPDFAQHMAVFERAAMMAKAFDCGLVRTFSFRWPHMSGLGNPSPRLPRGGGIPAKTLDLIRNGLSIPARMAEREGLSMGLENVRSCYANTGENLRIVIDAVGSPALKAVWDPANSFVSGGVDYPDGYEAVRPHMVHVHFKDARVRDAASGLTSWECIGEGEVRLRDELAAFIRDGYSGVVSGNSLAAPGRLQRHAGGGGRIAAFANGSRGPRGRLLTARLMGKLDSRGSPFNREGPTGRNPLCLDTTRQEVRDVCSEYAGVAHKQPGCSSHRGRFPCRTAARADARDHR